MDVTPTMTEVMEYRPSTSTGGRGHLRDGFPSLPDGDQLSAVLRLVSAVSGRDRVAVVLADRSALHYLGTDGGWATVGWDGALCEATVLCGSVVSVADASLDARFAGSPWVDGRRGTVRAYTGVPLVCGDQVVGSLCSTSGIPGALRDDQVAALGDLATLVVAVLDRWWAAEELATAHAELVRAHADAARERAFTHALLEALPVGVVAGDADQRVQLFNRVSRQWHGQDTDPGVLPEQLSVAYDLFEADGVTPLAEDRIPLLRAYREGRVDHAEIVIRPHGHAARTVACSATQVRDDDGELLGAVVAMADITPHRDLERQLRSAALHDTLTGLPNRRLLQDRLEHALHSSGRDRSWVAVLYVDLDGFKAVNDQHGHAVGDEVLVLAAHRLTASVRTGDTVARMGGDEFVVLCPGIVHTEEVQTLSRRLATVFCEPLVTSAGPHRLSLSVGHALGQADADPTRLVDAADRAMYRTKKARRAARVR
ncbi:diguanylate cyclase domain-containing protein [Klenkia sp. PcliD-1-E]|uniref:diguanylate cyclase domain-containing protein n=1 Tax=Klenkia sp. PcliD-1-E TaxID=2954492 RepID=UPI002097AFBB|nr:diguanylate cyclase [Klenkia sp. PcliD-1-E]MCO7218285.1 diguanylate cyclase [Klenkia sp. PcliD-1-E]